MSPFLWAASSFQKNHNEPPKVAKLAKKSPNLMVTLIVKKVDKHSAVGRGQYYTTFNF
jgi:hypothetical protein